MEPRIQYAKTNDGVNVAFWTLGRGDALVYMLQPLLATAQADLQVEASRTWYEELASRRRIVRFDYRGSGLSTRHVSEFPVETMSLDLEAVVERLGLERFDIWAEFDSGPIAIHFTAKHPERVHRLILWCSWARGADISERESIETLERLIDTNWRLYMETIFGAVAGDRTSEARRYAEIAMTSVSPHELKAFLKQAWEYDVSSLLPHVQCPTLVMHRRNAPQAVSLEVSKHLASSIPCARLVLLEQKHPLLLAEGANVRIIEAFLDEGEVSAAIAPSGLVTILFTDIEGSTALTQRLGDAKAREVLREHERIVRECLREHGGSEIKTMGDGFMASFGSATRALECAIAIQRGFEDWNRSLPARPEALEGRAEPQPSARGSRASPRAEEVRVRIGLNAGEPIAEESDLFGTAVIMAERVCGQAEGGEILVSNVVRELAAGKGFLFADRGETTLRGFDDPVRLYEVRWREEG